MTDIPADILLYALVAAGLVFWLKNLLGTRHGEERSRQNPFTQKVEQKEKSFSQENKHADENQTLALNEDNASIQLPRNVRYADGVSLENFGDLLSKDKHFDLPSFTMAAQDAFVIVVEAFAQDDRDTLRDLLHDPVYDAFVRALQDRVQKGETVSTEIHAIHTVEIMEVELQGSVALITLRFIADETAVIKDKDGDIISGDPDRITQMNDIWVFGRNTKSKDPRWLVHETRDGDVTEDHKTPMPDAG